MEIYKKDLYRRILKGKETRDKIMERRIIRRIGGGRIEDDGEEKAKN